MTRAARVEIDLRVRPRDRRRELRDRRVDVHQQPGAWWMPAVLSAVGLQLLGQRERAGGGAPGALLRLRRRRRAQEERPAELGGGSARPAR